MSELSKISERLETVTIGQLKDFSLIPEETLKELNSSIKSEYISIIDKHGESDSTISWIHIQDLSRISLINRETQERKSMLAIRGNELRFGPFENVMNITAKTRIPIVAILEHEYSVEVITKEQFDSKAAEFIKSL